MVLINNKSTLNNPWMLASHSAFKSMQNTFQLILQGPSLPGSHENSMQIFIHFIFECKDKMFN